MHLRQIQLIRGRYLVSLLRAYTPAKLRDGAVQDDDQCNNLLRTLPSIQIPYAAPNSKPTATTARVNAIYLLLHKPASPATISSHLIRSRRRLLLSQPLEHSNQLLPLLLQSIDGPLELADAAKQVSLTLLLAGLERALSAE